MTTKTIKTPSIYPPLIPQQPKHIVCIANHHLNSHFDWKNDGLWVLVDCIDISIIFTRYPNNLFPFSHLVLPPIHQHLSTHINIVLERIRLIQVEWRWKKNIIPKMIENWLIPQTFPGTFRGVGTDPYSCDHIHHIHHNGNNCIFIDDHWQIRIKRGQG